MARNLVLAATAFLTIASGAEAQHRGQDEFSTSAMVRLVNETTIGLAAGRLEGAPLRFAAELARAVDDGDKMRILPVVTRGPSDNISDLLYLRGIDAAIVYGDSLDQLKQSPRQSDIERRINYLTHLFPSEFHVFARPEIKTIQDLAGKPVNFNTKGTAAAYSGPIIFDRLGIKVDARFDPHPVAMAEMANSERYAATVWVSTKPLDPFLKRKWPSGFKFLPVPMNQKLEEYYIPAQLDAGDYPNLIPAGQTIQTIGVPAVLAVFAWPEGSDRHRRLARLIDYLFERLPKLQTASGFHPAWREINLSATVPGWKRYNAMQRKLDAIADVVPKTKSGAIEQAAPILTAPVPQGRTVERTRTVVRDMTEEVAIAALQSAGFANVSALARDSRKIWRGSAHKGRDLLSVAVDNQGNVYSRLLSRQ